MRGATTDPSVGPCPSWCEYPAGHVYDELCPGAPGVVTRLDRLHRRELGTVWSTVYMGIRDGSLTLAHSVALWMVEEADPEGANLPERARPLNPRCQAPQVVVSEAVDGFARPHGMQQMDVHQAEALAELLTLGVQACREIEAGREPVFPLESEG